MQATLTYEVDSNASRFQYGGSETRLPPTFKRCSKVNTIKDRRKQGMKSLKDLNNVSVMDTSNHDLTREFFTPLLSNSIRYDRGVGFFSSSWLRINSYGMVAFANHGGRARWVTSPILDEADWEA